METATARLHHLCTFLSRHLLLVEYIPKYRLILYADNKGHDKTDIFAVWSQNSRTGAFFNQNRITKTRLFKHIENFTTKTWKFSDNNSDIFIISAQTIDCGYWLELPRPGSSNE